jgi:HPr kinase/phosphorylase
VETAPARLHGTLVEVASVGVLLLGPSGIGKSECAAELVVRGYRFVADDVVQIERGGDGRLMGEGPELVRHHLELRGIGIVHVPSLFGPDSVAERAAIDLVVELEVWGMGEVERVGLERETRDFLGISVSALRLPVAPGRNVATLIEVAAREFTLRRAGGSGVDALDRRIARRLGRRGAG